MELIAKTTRKCDMACTFCSAAGCNEHIGLLRPEEVAEAAVKIHASSIILLGGENFTLPVSYFEKILELTPDEMRIEMTSNLKNFFLHPDKWTPLLRNPRITVATSFNYGNSRKWDKNTVYDEKMFRKVMALFKERIGYMPMFIAVIDEDNEKDWLRHVMLAKELGTTCRLNNSLALGRGSKYYPRSHMYRMYTQLINMGLEEYEVNARDRGKGHCPENGNLLCESTIRVIKRMNNGEIKYFTCDDDSNCDTGEVKELVPVQPKECFPKTLLKAECYACRLCRICNGCHSNSRQIRDKEAYCAEMKEIEEDLVRQGWCM